MQATFKHEDIKKSFPTNLNRPLYEMERYQEKI